jgi:hypothetical protein
MSLLIHGRQYDWAIGRRAKCRVAATRVALKYDREAWKLTDYACEQ